MATLDDLRGPAAAAHGRELGERGRARVAAERPQPLAARVAQERQAQLGLARLVLQLERLEQLHLVGEALA